MQAFTYHEHDPPAGVTPAVALIQPKYPHNVGAAVRAASCFGIRQVGFTGDRVSLSAGKRQRLPREERMRGYQQVQLRQYDRIFDVFDRQTVPVAVELRTGAELLPTFEHPEHALYVFGPEDGSLRSAELSRCHRFVVIPTRHCVNLASAVYLVLYDRMVKRQALGLDPVLPIDQVLAEQRGFLEPDSMAPSVGVRWGDQDSNQRARP
jgi:tRNA(Leu) C34 or U34 (ribose-2'-O)-methylase TrmL